MPEGIQWQKLYTPIGNHFLDFAYDLWYTCLLTNSIEGVKNEHL